MLRLDECVFGWRECAGLARRLGVGMFEDGIPQGESTIAVRRMDSRPNPAQENGQKHHSNAQPNSKRAKEQNMLLPTSKHTYHRAVSYRMDDWPVYYAIHRALGVYKH
jgi:hypothetical protein